MAVMLLKMYEMNSLWCALYDCRLCWTIYVAFSWQLYFTEKSSPIPLRLMVPLPEHGEQKRYMKQILPRRCTKSYEKQAGECFSLKTRSQLRAFCIHLTVVLLHFACKTLTKMVVWSTLVVGKQQLRLTIITLWKVNSFTDSVNISHSVPHSPLHVYMWEWG